ncbi:hypothetical protein FKM82_031249 [Ascaphus truei]
MCLILQLRDVSQQKECSQGMRRFMPNQLPFLRKAPAAKHELPEIQSGASGELSVMSEREISAELLHLLQNNDVIESLQGKEERELLESIESWLKLHVDHNESPNSEAMEGGASPCQPHTHIFFLKTHKTASSTIMNMLFRFGESRNLTFAFPSRGASQFFYPSYFSAPFVGGFFPNTSGTFHIMCHHMRFLLTEVEKVMPSDTFYFTILRNPVSLMESSFTYYKSIGPFSKAMSLEDFINHTSKFYNPKARDSSYAKNLMTFDLGFDQNGRETAKHFQLTSRVVEATFNLVLIAEYFDESLILLKDALCWTLDDVLSFPLNIRSNSSRNTTSQETQDLIKSWNQLDWQLYVYFNSSFWYRVGRFGRERMQREVVELQRRRVQLSETCLSDEGLVEPNRVQDKSLKPYQTGMAKILGYNLKPGLGEANRTQCQRLVTPELQYSTLLQQKQRLRNLLVPHRERRQPGLRVNRTTPIASKRKD